MTLCVNPACPDPQNADPDRLCRACGALLWLSDRYRPLQVLGQGRSGKTILAVDQATPAISGSAQPRAEGQRVVLKQFSPQLLSGREQAIALFGQEARRLKELGQHPQIPDLLDVFEQAGQLYFVQEWIPGQTLAEILAQQGAFSEVEIWRLLEQLLPILHFIHQHQIIHRDIKPENIIWNRERWDRDSRKQDGWERDRLFLVDFGAAKFVAAKISLPGTVMGSPEYIAPEQARGRAVYASDLYSLGVTCIHLLTDLSPFELFDTVNDRWIWRRFLTQPVSDRLITLLDRLIQNAVGQRFVSAAEVLQAMGAAKPIAVQAVPTEAPLDTITTPSVIHAIALHPGLPLLATAGDDKMIYLWDLDSHQRVGTLSGHTGHLRALACCIKNDTQQAILASAGDDKRIRLWDWQTRQPLAVLAGHTHSVRSLQFHPMGQILASGSWDKSIRLWQVETGKLLHSWIGHTLQVTAVAFSPDGKMLASASCDRTVRLWALESLEPQTICTGHVRSVLAVAFSPDGQILASGGDDNTIRLWDRQTGQLLQTLAGHSWSVSALAFSQDGRWLLSGSWDKTIKIWDLAQGTVAAVLTGHSDSHAIALRSPLLAQSANAARIYSGGREQQVQVWQWPFKTAAAIIQEKT
jgi:serine/threonine protein kinase